MRLAQKRPRNREPLLLTAGNFDAALANHGIESLIGASEQRIRCSLVQDVETLDISSVRTNEQKIFANRPREKLRILRHESDPLAQTIEIDDVARIIVIE